MVTVPLCNMVIVLPDISAMVGSLLVYVNAPIEFVVGAVIAIVPFCTYVVGVLTENPLKLGDALSICRVAVFVALA